ncbi:hypothetical protein PVK06_040579 [Gossypium arboreum]|uniref:Uncharacterized protein n=1 Tax=Gossypium arboreum TaxID=29729 RepID=A0ABR0N5T9_GOSAR|nr:hypothetical protein PVK06_040579 [Gossypium arboreum]
MMGSTSSEVSSIQKVRESHPLPYVATECATSFALHVMNPLQLLLRQIPFHLQRQPLGDMYMLLQLSDLGCFD